MNNGMTTGWIFLCCASHMWSCSTLLYYILLSALLIHLFCRLFPLPHSFFDLFILAQLCKGPKCFCVAHTMSYDSALPVQATCRLPHRLGISVSHWLEFNCVPNQGKCKLVWPHGGHVGPFAGKLCWLKSFLDSKKDHYINEVSVKWWFYLVHWVKIFPSPRGQYWTYSEPRCREKYQGILLTCYAQGARQVYYVWCRAGLHSVFVLRISKLYHDW